MEKALSVFKHNQHIFENPNTDHIFYLDENDRLCFVNSTGEYGLVNYVQDYFERDRKIKPSFIKKNNVKNLHTTL